MSKTTLVSLIPFEVNERKPVYPGHFYIQGAKENDIEILVIENAKAFRYLDEFRGTDTINIDSEEIAKAVVEDYINSQLAVRSGEGLIPGLFYIPGEHTKIEVKTKYKDIVSDYRVKQTKWFEVLVRMADDDWEKTRQHRVISGIQRYAARFLNLERPWLIEPKMTKCIACKTTVEENAVICPICRVVLNQDEYKKLQFAETR